MEYIARVLDAEYPVFRIVAPDSGKILYFRMLSLKEYERLSGLRGDSLVHEWLFYEEVFKYSYLSEYNLLSDDMPAGFTVSIGQLVMYLSGDCDRETILIDINSARVENPADTLLEYMRTVIFSVFKSYTLEDIQSWDRKKFIKTFTIAENILSKQREDFKRLDLKDLEKSMTGKKRENSNAPIDFEKENRSISQNTDRVENENILSQEQLQKLSNMRRG